MTAFICPVIDIKAFEVCLHLICMKIHHMTFENCGYCDIINQLLVYKLFNVIKVCILKVINCY